MTRYEFAVAIARLLDKMQPQTVDAYTRAEADARFATKGDLAGLATKEEVDNLRRLVNEFQNELTTLGVEVDNIKRRLDGLEGRLTNVENEMKRIRVGGAANFMIRGNHRQGRNVQNVTDQDGFLVTRGVNQRGSLLSDTRVLHDLDLNITARLSDTATAEAIVNFGNYLPFLNSIASFSGARSDRFNSVNPALGQRVNQDQQQTIYKLAVEAPIRLPGIGGVNLAVGRIPVQFSNYTLKQIDVDSYFANNKTDLGDIPVDGARGTFKVGPVAITGFAAKLDPIKNVSDVAGRIDGTTPGYGLFAGAGRSPFTAGFQQGGRPRGSLINPATNGAMAIENLAGARATLGASFLGTVGLTYLAAGGLSAAPGSLAAGADFDRVYVYGADINTNLAGIGLMGSYTVSNTASSAGETGGDTNTVRDDDTYAWEAGASYNLGALSLGGGYRYVSPFFAAPGYWDKVGAWTNPVDVEGPFVKASYALGGGLALSGEAKFYQGTDQGFLTNDDKITNFRAGLKYGLTSASSVDLGAEWTRYEGNNFGGAEPREVFYNIGYGFSFNPNASFKLLYQIVNYDDKGTNFDPGSGNGGVAAAQFSVKF